MDKINMGKITVMDAYLKMLDANDPRERTKLLTYILKDSKASMLFIFNCSPTRKELTAAFNKIVNEPQYCYEFLRRISMQRDLQNLLTSEQRLQAIYSILPDPELSWQVSVESKLTNDEKKIIYKAHYKYFLRDKTLKNYWDKWNIFGDIFQNNEMNELVNMIYACESNNINIKESIELLLKYGKLTISQRDKLNSKLVANALI